MRLDLADDPAVIGIADATGLNEYDVIGRLHKIWSWANRQTGNGELPNVKPEWIDRYVGHEGFADAMIVVGWLHVENGGVTIPNFDRWNSGGAKNRLLNNRRVAKSRAKKKET